jgi:hypothetical protein
MKAKEKEPQRQQEVLSANSPNNIDNIKKKADWLVAITVDDINALFDDNESLHL